MQWRRASNPAHEETTTATETANKNQRTNRWKEEGRGTPDPSMTVREQSRKVVQDLMNRILSAKTLTKIGTWNVRTMYQSGNLAQVSREADNYGLKILGISEMRWTGSGRMTSNGRTVLYSGQTEHHQSGVGLILSKEAARCLIGWEPVSDRILTARFQSCHTKTTVIQVYAPTEDSAEADKDAFYNQLQDTFNRIPDHDVKILMGDLNAKIDGDRTGMELVVGPHGSAQKTNNNGERLLLFCSVNSLAVANTFFAHKDIHKKTWRSPDGKTNNEIDYLCISQRWKTSIKDVKACRGADVGSDHHLVRAMLQLRLKRLKKSEKVQPFATTKLKDPETVKAYQLQLHNRFQVLQETGADLEEQWADFKVAVTKSAEATIGRRRGSQREKWIQEKTWDLIDERKEMKNRRQQARSTQEKEKTVAQYSAIDRKVKKSCRADKKQWLEKKGAEAEAAAGRNDTGTLYRIVRDLTGIRNNSNVPIKDKQGQVLLTTEAQDSRWVEHFKEILNQPEPPSTFDFTKENRAAPLDVQTSEITREETLEAIGALKNNRAAGWDEITGEMLKHGGEDLVTKLTELLNSCWEKQDVPRDWQQGMIVKLPKKGNISDCNNWRGITLLSVPGKVLSRILLKRLRAAVDARLREEQAGFRAGRSCTEQIFTLRNILEQCVEYQKSLAVNFVDFKKAFDSVHRHSLWQVAELYGIPGTFINIFKSIYQNSSCCVKTDTGTTEFFNIETGVRQGCILSPFLFLLIVDFVMNKATAEAETLGVEWVGNKRLTDLDFADDIALLAENTEGLQQLTMKLEETASKIGLRISCEKTKVMKVGAGDSTTPVKVGSQPVHEVEQFTYLGSLISRNGDAEADVNNRIGKAAAVFRRMNNIWRTSTINTQLKIRLYNAVVLPTALYASETWKSTAKVDKKLDVFHQRCLRRIMKISYKDHITNEEVLRRAKSRPLHEIVTVRRLKLAGHVLRLPISRYAKTAMTWVPSEGKRKQGGQKRTWRRTFQKDLQRGGIAWEEVEEAAADRDSWRMFAAQCPAPDRRN